MQDFFSCLSGIKVAASFFFLLKSSCEMIVNVCFKVHSEENVV